MGNKKITIYDLAEKLQVSAATVSRGLNDHPSISEATKKRIVAVAKASGYRVNKFASNLSAQKTRTLGVIVPRLDSYFMSTVLAGIEQVASGEGYNLIISQSLEQEEKEKLNTRTLSDSGVDALLISLASGTSDYGHLMEFQERDIPLLFFDRVNESPKCPRIVIDNVAAGYEATRHLLDQGCTNLLHISGNLKRNVYADRYDGFRASLEAQGLRVKKHSLLVVDINKNDVSTAIDHIKRAKKPFDGIFISNDSYAAFCMKALIDEGYRIPQDIKVVGFNNDPISEVISPKLTTIHYPGHEMGVLAGQSILSHLKGKINLEAANTITLSHQLIIRESSINPKT